MKAAQQAQGCITFAKSMNNFVETLDMALNFTITIFSTDFDIIDLI